jgi:monoterpene epsilon-lactone hydrolase
MSGISMSERSGEDPIFAPEMIHGMFAGYLAGADPRSPAVSPLFADLAGLPPLMIVVGSAELLYSDSERLAAAASYSGVEVTLEVGQGLPHVYPIIAHTPEAVAAGKRIGAFLRAKLR